MKSRWKYRDNYCVGFFLRKASLRRVCAWRCLWCQSSWCQGKRSCQVVIWISWLMIIHTWQDKCSNQNVLCFKLRCVLGKISSVGGTVFALQVLIVAALLGGKLVSLIGGIKSFKLIQRRFFCRLSLFQNCQERYKTSGFIGNADNWNITQEHSI